MRYMVTMSLAIAFLFPGLVASTGPADNIRVVIILARMPSPIRTLPWVF